MQGYLDLIAPACFVYGITPDIVSQEYRLQDVVALSEAATRFLATIARPALNRPMKKHVAKSDLRGPDIAGFRELYGSHYHK